jgi:hypothetical protein
MTQHQINRMKRNNVESLRNMGLIDDEQFNEFQENKMSSALYTLKNSTLENEAEGA